MKASDQKYHRSHSSRLVVHDAICEIEQLIGKKGAEEDEAEAQAKKAAAKL